MAPETTLRLAAVGFFERIGAAAHGLFEEVGRFFYILHSTFYWTFRRPFDGKQWLRQMVRVGVDSLPVVGLTAMFTGMVMALQTFRSFERFHAEGFVGSVVSLSLTRELAPVLTALMIAGRIGSSLAAELGTMRVTEQIDALYAMATEPLHYLVVPRVAATTLMLPPLVALRRRPRDLRRLRGVRRPARRQPGDLLGEDVPVPRPQRRLLRAHQGRRVRPDPLRDRAAPRGSSPPAAPRASAAPPRPPWS